MSGAKRLLASFEETRSLTRPTSPLTGTGLAASWSWAQGSCELPTAKPRMRSPIAPLRGASSNQSGPRGRSLIQFTTAQPSFQASAIAYQLAEIDRFQRTAGLVEEVVPSLAVTDSKASAGQPPASPRETEVEMANVESIGCEADARSFRDEDAAAVHEEIGRLPERYRRAVVLCHFEGLTHAEAARRLGCAPGTVASLVSRARDLLRTRLVRRGLTAGSLMLAAALEPKIATASVPFALERATIQAALCFATKRAVAAGIVSQPAAELAGEALKP